MVAAGSDPPTITVHTGLNGAKRQDYPAFGTVPPPATLVSLLPLSLLPRGMTLVPGDVICCGTPFADVIGKPGTTVGVTV